MHPLAETLLDEPVIAAVKTDEALTAALASPCSTIFLLASTLLTVDGLVHRYMMPENWPWFTSTLWTAFRRGRSRWTPSTPCATRTASSPPARP